MCLPGTPTLAVVMGTKIRESRGCSCDALQCCRLSFFSRVAATGPNHIVVIGCWQRKQGEHAAAIAHAALAVVAVAAVVSVFAA